MRGTLPPTNRKNRRLPPLPYRDEYCCGQSEATGAEAILELPHPMAAQLLGLARRPGHCQMYVFEDLYEEDIGAFLRVRGGRSDKPNGMAASPGFAECRMLVSRNV